MDLLFENREVTTHGVDVQGSRRTHAAIKRPFNRAGKGRSALLQPSLSKFVVGRLYVLPVHAFFAAHVSFRTHDVPERWVGFHGCHYLPSRRSSDDGGGGLVYLEGKGVSGRSEDGNSDELILQLP